MTLTITGWPVLVAALAWGLSVVIGSVAVVLSVYKRTATRRRNTTT